MKDSETPKYLHKTGKPMAGSSNVINSETKSNKKVAALRSAPTNTVTKNTIGKTTQSIAAVHVESMSGNKEPHSPDGHCTRLPEYRMRCVRAKATAEQKIPGDAEVNHDVTEGEEDPNLTPPPEKIPRVYRRRRRSKFPAKERLRKTNEEIQKWLNDIPSELDEIPDDLEESFGDNLRRGGVSITISQATADEKKSEPFVLPKVTTAFDRSNCFRQETTPVVNNTSGIYDKINQLKTTKSATVPAEAVEFTKKLRLRTNSSTVTQAKATNVKIKNDKIKVTKEASNKHNEQSETPKLSNTSAIPNQPKLHKLVAPQPKDEKALVVPAVSNVKVKIAASNTKGKNIQTIKLRSSVTQQKSTKNTKMTSKKGSPPS